MLENNKILEKVLLKNHKAFHHELESENVDVSTFMNLITLFKGHKSLRSDNLIMETKTKLFLIIFILGDWESHCRSFASSKNTH